ncbi:MAG: tetratricopeptide repeat protein [Pyrinomonadaceae bacterium]
MLGVAYASLGEHRQAIKATRTGLEVSPDDPMAHFNIGKSFFALGESEPAISAFSKAAGYAPDFCGSQLLDRQVLP